jgi:hypothetical protein
MAHGESVHDANGDRQARLHNGASELDGLSLRGEAGREVVRNATRLAIGSVSLVELNDPRYGLSPDGVPQVRVNEETFRALGGTI